MSVVVSDDNSTYKISSFIYIFYVDSICPTFVYILLVYVAAAIIVP